VNNEPHFAAKSVDGDGPDLDPPEHTLAWYVDEQSQTPALDRTQPSLPTLNILRSLEIR